MDWEHNSGIVSIYENVKNPLLSDVEPEEFRKIFFKARKKLRRMRIQIILNFFLKNPIKVLKQFFSNLPFYLNRFNKELFRT